MNTLESRIARAEELLNREQVKPAEELIAEDLKAHPTHPELNRIQARLEAYSQREFAASKRLKYLAKGKHLDELGQLLTNYLYCRAQIAKKFKIGTDTDALAAESAVKKAGSWSITPGIGTEISAILIVKNEEQFLDACLASLKDIADEIVVVDTGSTDRTVEIAKTHGAKLGYFEWCQDFAAARNASIELATKPWLFWIDADEVLQPGATQMLTEAVMRPHMGGYLVRLVNFLDENQQTQFVHTAVRLFQNRPDIRFTGKIHEQIANRMSELGLAVATLGNVVLNHYGYQPNLMVERDKLDRTLSMIQAELKENPNDPFQLFNLAMTYSVAGDQEKTVETASKCAENLGEGYSIGFNVYQMWASALRTLGRNQDAIAICDLAKKNAYDSILTYFEETVARMGLSDWEGAWKSSNELLAAEWSDRLCGDTSIIEFKRDILAARCSFESGRPEEALTRIQAVLASMPNLSEVWVLNGAILGGLGRTQESIASLEKAMADPNQHLNAMLTAASVCINAGDFNSALSLCKNRWNVGGQDEQGFHHWLVAAEKLNNSNEILAATEAYRSVFTPLSEQWVAWGQALLRLGEAQIAMDFYQKASAAEPENPNPYFCAGDLWYSNGLYLEAIQNYEQGLRIQPGNVEGWFVLANALFQVGSLPVAEGAYQECLRLDPNHRSASLNLETLREEMQSVA